MSLFADCEAKFGEHPPGCFPEGEELQGLVNRVERGINQMDEYLDEWRDNVTSDFEIHNPANCIVTQATGRATAVGDNELQAVNLYRVALEDIHATGGGEDIDLGFDILVDEYRDLANVWRVALGFEVVSYR